MCVTYECECDDWERREEDSVVEEYEETGIQASREKENSNQRSMCEVPFSGVQKVKHADISQIMII